MLFREDNVARADADAIRKGVGFTAGHTIS